MEASGVPWFVFEDNIVHCGLSSRWLRAGLKWNIGGGIIISLFAYVSYFCLFVLKIKFICIQQMEWNPCNKLKRFHVSCEIGIGTMKYGFIRLDCLIKTGCLLINSLWCLMADDIGVWGFAIYKHQGHSTIGSCILWMNFKHFFYRNYIVWILISMFSSSKEHAFNTF